MTELRKIAYQADGVSLAGYLADGSGGKPAPGLLVAHEGGGLSRHSKERAQRLAASGYIAFALDYFGEEEPSLERAMELGKALRGDPAALRRRMAAALDVLIAQPGTDPGRLAAIGHCMGGTAAIELARSGAPLAAIVGFHSGFLEGSAADNRAIRCPLLLCHGADDPVVGAAPRDAFLAEMSAAGVDWQLHLYGGVGHSFTNPDIDTLGIAGFAYDAKAEQRSWAAMLHFLDETMGRP